MKVINKKFSVGIFSALVLFSSLYAVITMLSGTADALNYNEYLNASDDYIYSNYISTDLKIALNRYTFRRPAPYLQDITKADVKAVTHLNISNSNFYSQYDLRQSLQPFSENVISVDISNNKIEGALYMFDDYANLKYLIADNNNLTAFSGMMRTRKLELISVNNNKITDLSIVASQTSQNIVVEANNNKIDTIGIGPIHGYAQNNPEGVLRFYVNNNKINNFGPIDPSWNAKRVRITGTALNQDFGGITINSRALTPDGVVRVQGSNPVRGAGARTAGEYATTDSVQRCYMMTSYDCISIVRTPDMGESGVIDVNYPPQASDQIIFSGTLKVNYANLNVNKPTIEGDFSEITVEENETFDSNQLVTGVSAKDYAGSAIEVTNNIAEIGLNTPNPKPGVYTVVYSAKDYYDQVVTQSRTVVIKGEVIPEPNPTPDPDPAPDPAPIPNTTPDPDNGSGTIKNDENQSASEINNGSTNNNDQKTANNNSGTAKGGVGAPETGFLRLGKFGDAIKDIAIWAGMMLIVWFSIKGINGKSKIKLR